MALTDDEDLERGIKEMGPSLNAISAALFKSLFVVFNFLFKEGMKYTKDYKYERKKNPLIPNVIIQIGNRFCFPHYCTTPNVQHNLLLQQLHIIIFTFLFKEGMKYTKDYK